MMRKLVTADDIAAMLGVGVDWVYSEARAGRIPHVRLGRNVRFRADAVDEWIQSREAVSMSGNAKRPRDRANGPGA